MSVARWIPLGLLAATAAAGVGWWLHAAQAGVRREQLRLLRHEHAELVAAKAENRQLRAAQPSSQELQSLRADHAALLQLRDELAALQVSIQAQAREAAAMPIIPADQWQNLGRITARATIETALWAAAHNDLTTLAQTLAFAPDLQPKVDAFFSGLPENVRTQYGTASRLIAAHLRRDLPHASMQILGQVARDDTESEFVVRLRNSDGLSKDVPMALHHTVDGWVVMVPPRTVQVIANEIGTTRAAAD
ncbi:MAG TPA: hypothetical protein VHE61_11400 [Opitutaceae bacterium]|nr:hypothetical protein [Opitutaceae bacterium]